MTVIRSSPSGTSYDIDAPLADNGLQSEWYVDPDNGNDDWPGSEEFPLLTVAELNRRISGVTIQQPTNVYFLGNVTDSVELANTTMLSSTASLTIQGVRTVRASGITVTVVTAIGPGSTYPWQLTTTGINWTTVVAAIGALPLRVDFSTGNIGMITEIVDANNIVVSVVGNRTAFATPVAGQTLEVVTFSTAPAPLIAVFPILLQTGAPLEFTDLEFTSGGFIQILSGPPTRFYGCIVNMASSATIFNNAVFSFRQCGIRSLGYNPVQGTNTVQLSGGVVLGNNSSTGLNPRRGHLTCISAMFQAAQILVSDLGYVRGNGIHIRATLNPIIVTTGGRFFNTNVRLSGSNNTGVGISVTGGSGFTYSAGANAKPTVTGTSDTLIGAVSRSYAQIPYFDLQLDAVPPTVATLVGSGAYMVNE